MRHRIVAALAALVLLPAGLSVLYAANAHPPPQHGCGIGFSGDRGTVHLNQDGTVNYTFLCTSAKYSSEAFLLLNVVGLATTGIGAKSLVTTVRGLRAARR